MKYEEAKIRCHIRSAIYREAEPHIKYWKNHPKTLDERVIEYDKLCSDWKEYDPREDDDCSLSFFND